MRRTGGIRRSRICLFVKLFSNFALLGLGDVARTRPDLYDLQYHLWLWVGDKKKAAYKDGVLDVLERRISSIGVPTGVLG